MDGNTRREKILEILRRQKAPMSGNSLAKELGVSRQVIVQDVALLRTAQPILATAQGYLLYEEGSRVRRAFVVRHGRDAIGDELNTIVDAGGKVLNVIVEHDVYGQISADLIISNRKEVTELCEKLAYSASSPLYILTDGTHIHTVEADTEAALDYIEKQLKEKKYLICE